MKVSEISLDDLWSSVEPADETFDPAEIQERPEPVRRYLEHAIEPGTPKYRAVKLQMTGEIKLGEWRPFEAQQVLYWDIGLIWKGTAKLGFVPVAGSDRFLYGQGELDWRILGIIPVAQGDGVDISRSAAGRLETESIFVPPVLLNHNIDWHVEGPNSFGGHLEVPGHRADVHYGIDGDGGLTSVHLKRWGNPDGDFHELDFGGYLSEMKRFQGVSIPTKVRAGWGFGSDSFETDGEFFRMNISHAEFL